MYTAKVTQSTSTLEAGEGNSNHEDKKADEDVHVLKVEGNAPLEDEEKKTAADVQKANKEKNIDEDVLVPKVDDRNRWEEWEECVRKLGYRNSWEDPWGDPWEDPWEDEEKKTDADGPKVDDRNPWEEEKKKKPDEDVPKLDDRNPWEDGKKNADEDVRKAGCRNLHRYLWESEDEKTDEDVLDQRNPTEQKRLGFSAFRSDLSGHWKKATNNDQRPETIEATCSFASTLTATGEGDDDDLQWDLEEKKSDAALGSVEHHYLDLIHQSSSSCATAGERDDDDAQTLELEAVASADLPLD